MAAVRCDVSPDSFGQSAEAVDDTVFGRQSWACHCWMLEDNCVIDGDMLGGVLNDLVASVMFKRWAYVESGAASEIPQALVGPLYVRDDLAAWWPHGGGIKVVETIDLPPC